MKKLMIALSAAALAFGVRAAVELPVGENFNDATEPSMITDKGESSISDQAYSFSKASTAGLPNQWALGVNPGKNLAVKTKLDTPAYYNLAEAQEMPASGHLETPLYFDSLVKFTYCDEDATVPTGSNAKLMVWVREDEEAGTTNLMITAGFYKAGVVQPEVKHYNCGPLAGYGVESPDDWCRLTIKAKGDITSGGQIPGFVVCVNGAPVTIAAQPEGNRDIGEAGSATESLNAVDSFWHAENHLFPSLIAGDTISAVGFAGQGAVDDISFANTEPTLYGGETTFCADKVVASITWPTDGSLTEVKVGDKTMTLTDGDVSVPAGVPVVVAATAADGWMITGGTGTVTPVEGTPSAITTAKIGVTIGDQKFATFADAIDYINGTTGSASGDLVVSFASDFAPEAFATTITPASGVTSLMIDLAGKTLTYTGEEDYAISCAVPLTITDSSEDKDGMITATSEDIDGIIEITEEVNFTVDAGIIAGYVAFEDATCNIITGGSFAGENEGFYLWDNATTKTYGDKTYEATYAEGYWTVTEPQIETFTVTVPVLTTGLTIKSITTNKVSVVPAVAGDYTLNAGETFSMIYEPDTGYKFTEVGETGVREATETKTIEAPTVELIMYTVTWDDSAANATAVATVDDAQIESDDEVAPGKDVVFTVTPNQDYEYASAPDGWVKSGDSITRTFTVQDEDLTVVIPVATAKPQGWPDDPSDWNGKKASEQISGIPAELANADAGTIAKWAKDNGNVNFADASMISTEAFLLDIDNASTPEQIQEAKNSFKITAISIDAEGNVTITAPSEEAYNGKVTVEGKQALTDTAWHVKTDGDQFFRATLTVKEVPAE